MYDCNLKLSLFVYSTYSDNSNVTIKPYNELENLEKNLYFEDPHLLMKIFNRNDLFL